MDPPDTPKPRSYRLNMISQMRALPPKSPWTRSSSSRACAAATESSETQFVLNDCTMPDGTHCYRTVPAGIRLTTQSSTLRYLYAEHQLITDPQQLPTWVKWGSDVSLTTCVERCSPFVRTLTPASQVDAVQDIKINDVPQQFNMY